MTQEEKFKEAKRLYETANADQKYVLESLFPELRESEDERIRKELIEYFRWNVKQILNDFDNKEVLAWLEAQGKHKPLGFNIGDEITVNGQICKVVAVEQKPVEWSSEQKHTLQTDDVPNKSSTAAPLRTGAIGFDGEPMESKPCEQKSAAWSEEDEINLGKAIWYVENPAPMVAKDSMLVEWLKNLRGRVQSQHKQEWNEDDEMMLGKCIDAASGYYSPEDKQSMKDWLKSLRPNSQWKPSDEQMAALDDFIYAKYPNIEKHGAVVKSLYQDLKKLKQ